MTTQPPRRKRSVAAGLTAVGAVAMLSGCDDNNDQARFGPPTEVAAFQTVQQCVDSGQYDRDTCVAAQQKAFNEDGKVAPFDPAHVGTRTQDLEPGYFDAGQFYWAKADTWLSGANIHANGRAIVLPEWRVVDIDTPEDWDRAEILHRALAGHA